MAARELAALPNGDLLVGTKSNTVYIIPNAEGSGKAGSPSVFIQLSDNQLNGVAYAPNGYIYIAGQYGLWRVPYQSGDQSESASSAVEIAEVRQGGIPPNSDGDVHTTSSVAVNDTTVFLSVGSSCNACTEIDPTRATIQAMGLNGENMHTLATRIRNAIAVAVNPNTGTLWAGGAGQDDLPFGHPYEFMDSVTTRLYADGGGLPVDYGWNECEEDQQSFGSGADCAGTAIPAVELTTYMTHIGATFYTNTTGTYSFRGSTRVLSSSPAMAPGTAVRPANPRRLRTSPMCP